MKRDRRVRFGEDLDPAGSDPAGDEIDLVQDVDDLFAPLLLGEVLLDRVAASPERIPSVEDLQDNVGRVDNLAAAGEVSTR